MQDRESVFIFRGQERETQREGLSLCVCESVRVYERMRNYQVKLMP